MNTLALSVSLGLVTRLLKLVGGVSATIYYQAFCEPLARFKCDPALPYGGKMLPSVDILIV